jgi:hypothetical protein
MPKLQTRRANRGPAAAHLGLLAVRTPCVDQDRQANAVTGSGPRKELTAEKAALERYQEMGAEFDD